MKIKTGILKLEDIEANPNLIYQERLVTEVAAHSKYKKVGIPTHDIALMFLDEPLQLTENINSICLPTTSINFNQICYVLSWQGKSKLIINM